MEGLKQELRYMLAPEIRAKLGHQQAEIVDKALKTQLKTPLFKRIFQKAELAKAEQVAEEAGQILPSLLTNYADLAKQVYAIRLNWINEKTQNKEITEEEANALKKEAEHIVKLTLEDPIRTIKSRLSMVSETISEQLTSIIEKFA